MRLNSTKSEIEEKSKAEPISVKSRHVQYSLRCINMLEVNIHNIRYRDNENEVIRNVSFCAEKGSIICITGRSGSGKSTLLNCITGIIPEIINASGEIQILYEGEKITYGDVGYIPEGSYNSLFYLSVEAQLNHIPNEEAKVLLQSFGLGDKWKSNTSELSMGERKIISLISILMMNNKICILDEPTAYLDTSNVRKILCMIEQMKHEKIIIIISHDVQCIDLADVKYELANGQLKQYDSIFVQPSIIEENPNVREDTHKNILLDLKEVTYAYPNGTKCLNNFSMTIYEGEILGICGRNGSGKTTIMRYILENVRELFKSGCSKKKLKCGGMLQDFHKQFFAYTVEKEIAFGDSEMQQDEYDKIIRYLELDNVKGVNPHFLSEGQKRLVLMGALVLRKLDILFLDEPFDNLDVSRVIKAKRMLKDYKANISSIIILDQNMHLYEDILDRVIYL